MELLNEIHNYLNKQMSYYMQIFEDMVRINSYTENEDGVNRLGKYTADLFSLLGFSHEFHCSETTGYGKHLFMTRSGNQEKTIACVSHLDTVFPPEEEQANNFSWKIEGDKIYGPGTNDIKGGTVLMFMMLDALYKCAPGLFQAVTWKILVSASEEVFSDDFAGLSYRELTGPVIACLVFESGFCDSSTANIVTARKGRTTFHIDVEGKGGHAGSDHKRGANAIVQLSEVISRAATITNYDKHVTCNIGQVSGGVAINRIPEVARAAGEIRAFEPEVLRDALCELRKHGEYKTVKNDDGTFTCIVTILIDRNVPAWPVNEYSNQVLEYWKQAALEMDMTIVEEHRGGLSDGNYFWDKYPTIDGLGPGGDNAHCSQQMPELSKEQEYAVMSSMLPKSVLNISAVMKLIHGLG